MTRSMFLTVVLVGLLGRIAAAQTVSVEVTVEAVEPQAKEITVAYKSGTVEKSITLDVSRKADITIKGTEAALGDITPGDTATLEYHKGLAIVTKIDAAGDLLGKWRFIEIDGSATTAPTSAFIVTKDDTLVCRSDSAGWYLITTRSYPPALFSIEYRYPKANRTGGAVVVASPGPALGDRGMSFGFEIKLGPGKCGEMELPRPDYKVELPLGQIRDARRVYPTRRQDPKTGNWNKLEVECNKHNNVVVKLNGQVINALAKAENVSGKIVIWPMKSEVHFRNPTVTIDGKEEKLGFDVITTQAKSTQ